MVWAAIREHDAGAFSAEAGGEATKILGFTEDALTSSQVSSKVLLATSIVLACFLVNFYFNSYFLNWSPRWLLYGRVA